MFFLSPYYQLYQRLLCWPTGNTALWDEEGSICGEKKEEWVFSFTGYGFYVWLANSG